MTNYISFEEKYYDGCEYKPVIATRKLRSSGIIDLIYSRPDAVVPLYAPQPDTAEFAVQACSLLDGTSCPDIIAYDEAGEKYTGFELFHQTNNSFQVATISGARPENRAQLDWRQTGLILDLVVRSIVTGLDN